MKSFKMLLLLFVILFFQDCNRQIKVNEETLVVFDLKDLSKTDQLKLSELGVAEIQYIPLQTNKDFFISIIKKFRIINNSFIVSDDHGRIFRFNNDGKFINEIGSIGRGPGEFQYPSDIAINNKNQQIIVCPLLGENKLKVFSLEGKFINTIPCPLYTRKIFYSDNGIFCWIYDWGKIGNLNSTFIIIDKNGNIIKEFPCKYNYRNSKYPNMFLEETFMYSLNDNLFIKELYSDTVFKLENLELKPKFVLNHGGKTISIETRKKVINHETFVDVFNKNCKEINLFEFGNYIYDEFDYEEFYGYISSFEGKSDYLFDVEVGIINDIDGGPNIRFRTIKDKTTIIGWTEAFKLKNYVASAVFKKSKPKFPEKKMELEKLANSLNENDNPVLMLVKLKE